jgi:hypothetical protein
LPKWEYFFHGWGCRLTHRVTGETIEAETGDAFDFYFWLNSLRSDRSPTPARRRMIELHPSFESLRVTLAELRDAGAIRSQQEAPHWFRLSDEAVAYKGTVKRFCELLKEEANRPRLREAVGDWDGVEDPGPVRKERLAVVLRHLDGTALQPEALYALADLRAPELRDRLRGVLATAPCTRLTVAALHILEGRGPEWCDDVYRLYQRLESDCPGPESSCWKKCVEFLLGQGYRTEEMLAALPVAGHATRGDAALLALEYSPADPTALFHRALLSKDRLLAAAVLAVLDSPWSRGILLSVLRESSDPTMTVECRAALRESHDPAAHEAANAWEKEHPPSKEEAWLDRGMLVRYTMEEVHDRVQRARRRFSTGA